MLSILIGLFISLVMPSAYFLINWQEFHSQAELRSVEITYNAKSVIKDNPDLWYYNISKFMEIADDSKFRKGIKSIKIVDKNENLIFEEILNNELEMVYSFRSPIKYNNEVYGFIEIQESIKQLVFGTVRLAMLFTILGVVIGVALYKNSVSIVRIAEKDVWFHAEQTKRQAELDVARLDRLKIVGQMAASIGHEIRNPMTTVRGYLQLFSRKDEFLPLASQFQLMIDELDRANSIITEFLSLAHNKAVKKKDCNLNSIIEKLEPLIQSNALLRGLSVEYDLKDIPEIYIDKKEIQQLILNITQNGLEAMTSGGCLFIKTDVENNEIRLLIIDQGTGIDPNILANIGTPFFTTKETGTGLGLAVCYSIAHRHQAKIEFIRSEENTICITRFPQAVDLGDNHTMHQQET